MLSGVRAWWVAPPKARVAKAGLARAFKFPLLLWACSSLVADSALAPLVATAAPMTCPTERGGEVAPLPALEAPIRPPGSATTLAVTTREVGATRLDRAVSVFTTSGWSTAGDGGGALWISGTGCPAPGRVISADGRCWTNSSTVLDVRQFGAVADSGGADATAALNDAMAFASSARRQLFVPAQVFLIKPAITFTSEGSALYRGAFPLRSNLHIFGARGATFKIADDLSSDAHPLPMAMFFAVSPVANISIRGMVLDMNGERNPISPRRPESYNRFCQCQIYVTGGERPRTALADHMDVEWNTFANAPGASNIVLAQSNQPCARLGSDWTISHNRFKDNGGDTDDHSSIYAWANDVTAEANIFTSARSYGAVGRSGPQVAFEIHGARQRFRRNVVSGYNQGVWIDSNYSTSVNDIAVSNNQFRTLFFGVATYRNLPTETALSGIKIVGNTFYFDDTVVASTPRLNLKQAVTITSAFAVSGVEVRENTVYKSGTRVASTFSNIVAATGPAQVHTDIVVAGNRGYGLSVGTDTNTNGVNGLGVIRLEDNRWTNLTPAGIFATTIGDSVGYLSLASPIQRLSLGGGAVIDDRAPPRTRYGFYLSGGIIDLKIRPTRLVGVQTATYYAPNLVVAHRTASR